jgi:DNA-binding NarL/FixJ family response regulator
VTAPARTVDERIIDLLLSGRGIDYVSEQGIVWGWTRDRALQVIAGQGWSLNRDGRLAHLEPQSAPPARRRPVRGPRPVPRPRPVYVDGPPAVRLTNQQLAVVAELCKDGPSNRMLAARLHVTEDTIKTHIKHALNRTGCTDRTALAVAILTRQVVIDGLTPAV